MKKDNSIAIVKQETSYLEKQDISVYLEKVARTIGKTRADIVVGPELALSSSVGMISLSNLTKKIDNFSKCFKGKLIIPGTGLAYEEGTKSMYNIAPIIFRDGSVAYVQKNSSHVEDLIAQGRGLEYRRGNLQEMVFPDKGGEGNLAVEICRDHGIGRLKRTSCPNLKFQFVLANNLLGVSPEKALVEEGGIVILAEGKEPQKSWAYKKKNGNLIPLKGNETKEHIVFD